LTYLGVTVLAYAITAPPKTQVKTALGPTFCLVGAAIGMKPIADFSREANTSSQPKIEELFFGLRV